MAALLPFYSPIGLEAGLDEAGRGCLAGPVSVGVAVINIDCVNPPENLADSKLLTHEQREELLPLVKSWVIDSFVGHATNQEIDEIGLTRALRRAGRRALAGLTTKPDHLILDGKHNWLLEPESDLFTTPISDIVVPVTMKIKADASCASVSAASVLAKVARDQLMREAALIHPDFGWEGNVGYGSSEHMAAIARLGPTDLHRKSWKLPSGPSQSGPDTA